MKTAIINMNKKIWILSILIQLMPISSIQAQIKIGDNPNAIGSSSLLELESTNKAFVLPRVANTAAIVSPVNGMMIYDNSAVCIKSYKNSQWSGCLVSDSEAITMGTISSLDCAGAIASPSGIIANQAYNGTLTVSYTGSAGGFYNGESVSSTGVTGLTASIGGGGFGFGSGSAQYTISGTPSAAGTASFAISLGGQSCTITLTVTNDAIRSALSVAGCASCTAYDAAAADAWVPVTAAEYDSVVTNVSSTSIGGLNETAMASPLIFGGNDWGGLNHTFIPVVTTNVSQISAGYIIAYSAVYGISFTDGLNGCTVEHCNAQSNPSIATQVGTALPASTTSGTTAVRLYYVLKTPTVNFSAGYLGSAFVGTNNRYAATSSYDMHWGTNASGLNTNYSSLIQCITTPTKQW